MKYVIFDNNKNLLTELHISYSLHKGDYIRIKDTMYLINSIQWIIETKSAGGLYDYSDLEGCIVVCTKVKNK